MLISAKYLIDRMRHGRSRADELLDLRQRLAAAAPAGMAGADEASTAQALLLQRHAISRAIGEVKSCRSCALGHPEPNGHWAGGHCCGARTADLFNDDEVAALRLSGTTAGRLRAPTGDHAGCSFRGATGCSLGTADRPNLCVRYLCPDLTRELHGRGDLPQIEALCGELEETYLHFIALRANRLARESEDEILG